MTNPKGKILVVGDWFIDENWLMAKTDNYHSTDVGEAHYNSLIEGPGNFVLSVCGVASILKVLSGDDISDDERNNLSIHDHFEIIGAGVN